jgi:multicomponent Na+:H+ antiporter subunit E
MTRVWALRAWALCWLVLVWILLWGNISAANVVSGIAVALLITLLLPLPVVPVEGRVHPVSLLKLVALVAWYLVQSSLHVAWLAVRPGPPPRGAVLRARLDVTSDLVLALLVNAINLTPGTLAIEIDRECRVIYIHVLDLSSPRARERFHHEIEQLERLLIATFERESDPRLSTEHR